MIKIPLYLTCLLSLSSCLCSCDAIIEPSLQKAIVKPEAPADNSTTSNYTVSFWWDAQDHALSYHLQVVTPSFTTPGKLVIDTVIKTNKFNYNMAPGSYQWHVLAQNGSSSTAYSAPMGFTILSSSLTDQKALLNTPANNTLTNQANIALQWSSLYGAVKYQLEIDTNNFVDENALVLNTSVPGQQFNYSFPKDQIFEWRVRAINDNTQSQWSDIYNITYDHTPPAIVTLTAPTNGQTTTTPIMLQWKPTQTAINYKIYIFKSDSVTNYSSDFPIKVSGTSYNFNAGKSGEKVYWKVSALDAAGNEGPASQLRNFSLQ